MKSIIRAALGATILISSQMALVADEPAEVSSAMRLVEMMKFNDTAVDSAVSAFKPMLQQFRQMGLPDEGIQELEGAARAFFTKTFNDPEMVRGIAAVYENNFTAAEIEELINFYQAPLGKKIIDTQPEVTRESMALGQKLAEKNQAAFQQEMMEIMGRFQNAPEPNPED